MKQAGWKAIVDSPTKFDEGDPLVRQADHVSGTENVRKSVEGQLETTACKTGDGRSRVFPGNQ